MIHQGQHWRCSGLIDMKHVKTTGQKIINIETITYICDVCGKIFDKQSNLKRCRMCGRDICDDCKVDYFEARSYDQYDGDYPDLYCKVCWDIGKEYIELYKKTREKSYEDLAKIEKEWSEKCLVQNSSK